jgi:hypothetical protein
MLRHQLLDMSGEDRDQESELLHAAHTARNALAILELKLRKTAMSIDQKTHNGLPIKSQTHNDEKDSTLRNFVIAISIMATGFIWIFLALSMQTPAGK